MDSLHVTMIMIRIRPHSSVDSLVSIKKMILLYSWHQLNSKCCACNFKCNHISMHASQLGNIAQNADKWYLTRNLRFENVQIASPGYIDWSLLESVAKPTKHRKRIIRASAYH